MAYKTNSFHLGAQVSGGANKPLLQLWNPSGSGVNLVVSTLYVWSTATDGEVSLLHATSALSLNLGSLSNKYLGEADSAGLYRIEPTGVSGALPGTLIFGGFKSNNGLYIDLADSPIIVPQNNGLSLGSDEAAASGTMYAQWDEEPA